jgi:hypothetical protein
MSQFENERSFSEDTFGLPQEQPTPLSNTYTFNPAHHLAPPSPLLLSPHSPFMPRPKVTRWDDDVKLFDPLSLSPLQENLEIELEIMRKDEIEAGKVGGQLPFIIEEMPKQRRSARIRKAKCGNKQGRERQTKLHDFLKKQE